MACSNFSGYEPMKVNNRWSWDCYWSAAWKGKTSTAIYHIISQMWPLQRKSFGITMRRNGCWFHGGFTWEWIKEPHTSAPKQHMVRFMHDRLWQYHCGLILRVVALDCAWKSLYTPPNNSPILYIFFLLLLITLHAVTLHAALHGSIASGVNCILVNPCKCWLQNQVLLL